jgi:hypothetical protein
MKDKTIVMMVRRAPSKNHGGVQLSSQKLAITPHRGPNRAILPSQTALNVFCPINSIIGNTIQI